MQHAVRLRKNTRAQSKDIKWHNQRKSRLTASLFGHVMRRRSIHPKSLVNTIVRPTKFTNESCKWGKWGSDNEKNALLKYQQHMKSNSNEIELCFSCGPVVNPKWPWLGASPDSLVKECGKRNACGAVEIKCPAPKADHTILEACKDKSFCLEFKENNIKLKQKHIYYYQCQGVMAICQLNWIDFVVFTKKDLHVERILFNEHDK